MDIVHHYDVTVRWDHARKGHMLSEAFDHSLDVATPPEFPGGMENIWSPEHLLVAAVNSCLMTTFLAIAENSKLNFEAFESKGVGTLEKVDGKYMISEIHLHPVLRIANEAELEKAQRILVKSEAACLISNSVKSAVHLHPKVLVGSVTALSETP